VTERSTQKGNAAVHHEQTTLSRTGLRALIRDHPMTTYLLLAFTGMWLSLLPALLFNAPIRPFTALGSVLGLALPAFLVTAITGGRVGVRDLAARSLRWRVGLRWHAVALLGLPVAALLIAATFLGAAPFAALADHWALLPTVFLPEVLIALVTIQLFEEIGWTGFAQHILQGRRGAFRASLLVALAFALIHLPTYLVGGAITGQRVLLVLVQMLPILVFAIFFRVLITWVYNGSGGSILLAATLHAAFNTLSGPGVTPAFVPGSAAMWLPLAAVAVLAALAVVVTKGRLAYLPRNRSTVTRGVSPAVVSPARTPLT
jgi:membrane protease YdiL (CAAX protease family)